MHEAGLVEDMIKGIVKGVEEQAASAQVRKVYLKLGNTAHADESSLRFWFENFSKGTSLEGAELDITVVDGHDITVDSLDVE